MIQHKLFISGKYENSAESFAVKAPWDRRELAKVHMASADQLESALDSAQSSFHEFRRSSRFLRNQLLLEMVKGLQEKRELLLAAIIHEAGKPRKLASAEIDRAVTTFTLAAEEAKRFGGEIVPLDFEESGQVFGEAFSHWLPRGPVLAISPFNFPLNLVAHKVAPALAVGTSVLLKPPHQAPGAAMLLAEIYAEARQRLEARKIRIPAGVFQVIHASNEVMSKALSDPRTSVLSFTGSDRTGFLLQQMAVRKKVLLELGGNAAVIVHQDADLQRAAQRIAFGAYAYAGQVCISVQRILVDEKIYESFKELLLSEIAKVKSGSPEDPDVINGPVIDSPNIDRILSWVKEAQAQGGKLLAGGQRQGSLIAPTLLESVPQSAKLSCEEVFGPVALLSAYKGIDEAIESVNASRFGLQAGIFSSNLQTIDRVVRDLEVGGVIVNEIPTYRSDQMPYGGAKDSGLGREGVRYTMQDYCEPKVVVTYRG